MDLPTFIEANLSVLIDDWTEYAGALSQQGSPLSASELQNSAKDLLMQIAADMRRSQSADQQHDRSHGAKRDSDASFDAASVLHADERLAHGFAINELIAEYRALRASVLRRWQQSAPAGAEAFQEMIRFNEAIDQAVAESVRQHARRTERIRDLFAGVLAHDLRSPLGVILNSADTLLRDEKLSPPSVRATAYVQRGALRMKRMIDDLLVFTRTRLGDTLPVSFAPLDMGRICGDAVDEVRALYPDASIDLRCTGDLAGNWDGGRINQLLVNLLSNAVRYGAAPVSVEAHGRDGRITLVVSNQGNPIPTRALPTLFGPLTRVNPSPERTGTAAGMGLGLYICQCIVTAHDGSIGVESTERGTAFTVQMPRQPMPSG